MQLRFAAVLACLSYSGIQASEQTQPAPTSRSQVAGTVTAVEGPAKRLSLHSDKGDAVSITATDRTLVIRIPPGETDVKKGTRIALTDIAAGDRIVVVSKPPVEGQPVEAGAILVMSKSDVAQVRQKEQEDWRRRGATGAVSTVDPVARTITLKVAARTVTIQPSEQTEYRRYSPDSARFSEAGPSSF